MNNSNNNDCVDDCSGDESDREDLYDFYDPLEDSPDELESSASLTSQIQLATPSQPSSPCTNTHTISGQMISSQSPSTSICQSPSTPCTSSYSFATPSSVTACCSSSEMPCTSSYLFATPSPVTPCSYLFATPSSVASGTSSQSSAATGTSSQSFAATGTSSQSAATGTSSTANSQASPVQLSPDSFPHIKFTDMTPGEQWYFASRQQLGELIPVKDKKRPRKPSPLRNKRPSSDHLLDGFLQRGCRCSSKCYFFFTREYYRTRRDQANSLATVELDMVVLGQIGACVNDDEVVGPSHHTPHQRKSTRAVFLHKGKRICRETFLTLHAIGKEK